MHKVIYAAPTQPRPLGRGISFRWRLNILSLPEDCFDYEACLAACAKGERRALHDLYTQESARLLGDGAERNKLYFELNQLLHAYNPWVPLTHVLSGDLRHPWLKNYKRHPVEFTTWRYLDVDVAQRVRAVRGKR